MKHATHWGQPPEHRSDMVKSNMSDPHYTRTSSIDGKLGQDWRISLGFVDNNNNNTCPKKGHQFYLTIIVVWLIIMPQEFQAKDVVKD